MRCQSALRTRSSRDQRVPWGCQRTLDHALITAPEQREPAMLAKLDAVAGRKGSTGS